MKIRYFGFLLLLISFISCDVQEVEYYKKQIYITHSGEQTQIYPIVSDPTDTLIGVYCGGSISTKTDVVVNLKIDQLALDSLNQLKFTDVNDYYQLLPDSCYNIPSYSTTIKKGAEYANIPVIYYTNKINPLIKYILPLSIKDVSVYEVNPLLKTVLVNIQLTNNYSGLYIYAGNAIEEGKTSKAKIIREQTVLVAGKNAILMQAESKTFEKDGNNYLIRATINTDNSITVTSDDQANLKVENCLPYPGVVSNPAIDNKYDPTTDNMRLVYKYNDFTKTGKMRIVVVDVTKIK